MASGGKKKTTMAKLNRESKLREKRAEKLARKEARKLAAANPQEEIPIEFDAEGRPILPALQGLDLDGEPDDETGDEEREGALPDESGTEASVPAPAGD